MDRIESFLRKLTGAGEVGVDFSIDYQNEPRLYYKRAAWLNLLVAAKSQLRYWTQPKEAGMGSK